MLTYYSQVPFVIKDKIFDMLAETDNSEKQSQKTQEKDPML